MPSIEEYAQNNPFSIFIPCMFSSMYIISQQMLSSDSLLICSAVATRFDVCTSSSGSLLLSVLLSYINVHMAV
jgi:hypothetical protein